MKDLWPLSGCRRKEARDMILCITQPDSPSTDLVGRTRLMVEVDGFDFDVGKESVLIEQHCTFSIMGHVEPIREKLVVDLLCHVEVLGSSCRC